MKSLRLIRVFALIIVIVTLISFILDDRYVYSFQPPEHPPEPDRLRPIWEEPLAPGAVEKGGHREELKGLLDTDEAIVETVREYISRNNLAEGLPIKLKYLTKDKNASGVRFIYVHFEQIYEDYPVARTYVNITLNILKSGRKVIVSANSRVYPALTIPPATISEAEARRKAQEFLGLSDEISPTKELGIVRYLREDDKQLNGWFELDEFNFSGIQDTIVVIALNENDIRAYRRDDGLYQQTQTGQLSSLPIEGSIKGRGVKFDPMATGQNLDILDLGWLELTADTVTGSLTTNADSMGQFIFPSIEYATEVSAGLKGLWADVISGSGGTFSKIKQLATPGNPVRLLHNPIGANEIPTAEVNGYYHTTFIHDWLKNRLPIPITGIDIPISVNVNQWFFCNAMYAGSLPPYMMFGSADSVCMNMAFDTVIYHEYGHFIDDMTNGIINGGLSEGWGDCLACYVTGQPIVGEGLPAMYIRRCDNSYQYPLNGQDEIHSLGQSWSGFAWDLRQNLINKYGQTQGLQIAEQLLTLVLVANSPDIPTAVWDTLCLDDDDSDLSNGTPNINEIVNAGQQHNLAPFWLPAVAKISYPATGGYFSQQNSVDIWGIADSSTLGVPFKDYQLFYAKSSSPNNLIPIGPPVTMPVTYGILGSWQIANLAGNNTYILRLQVNTIIPGLQFQYSLNVDIENNPPKQITTNPANQGGADISGNLIVYGDDRNGSLNRDIYLFDLTTNTERQITTDPGNQQSPSISGNFIVWEDDRNGGIGSSNKDIYLYDLTTNTERQITTNTQTQTMPDISGNFIVWQDNRNGPWDIYLYDLSTNIETRITNDTINQVWPRISGNLIVWYQFSSTGPTNTYIYIYDLITNTKTQITSNGMARYPDISGNQVVWEDYRNGNNNTDIYLYNLNTNIEKQITNAADDQRLPAISGNLIFWEDDRKGSGNPDIYLYNLNTGLEQQVTAHPANKGGPKISGNRVVWDDLRNGNNNADIYMATVIPLAPPPQDKKQ